MHSKFERGMWAIRQPAVKLFQNWWAWELIAGYTSILSLISLHGLLRPYDGRPPPPLRWGITLNAIVALLSTVMKAGILSIIAESLSQEKWNRYKSAKENLPLLDLQTFDYASRGGFGSLALLWRLRKGLW